MEPMSAEDFLARLRDEAQRPGRGAGLFDFDSRPAAQPVQCLLPDCAQPTHVRTVAPIVIQRRMPPHPGWWIPNGVWRALWVGWHYLRAVSGDDAYERYLIHVAQFHPQQRPMDRRAYFLHRQDQKWNRLSRCC